MAEKPEACEYAPPPRQTLDADSAAWLQDSLYRFTDVVNFLGLLRHGMPAVSDTMLQNALAGAVRGLAREIAENLGYQPGENLESYWHDRRHGRL